MADPEDSISQLQGILENDLDWTKYQAAAYCVLVTKGEMTPQDLHLEADIPDSRVYGILSQLEDRGCVKSRSVRPAIYEAVHPRQVIERELENFREKSEAARSRLEQAWEAQQAQNNPPEDAWAVSSISGVANEITSRMEEATESIRIYDRDLSWLTRQSRRELGDLSENGVEIQAIGMKGSEALARLADIPVDVRQRDSLEKSFYIFDSKHVVIRTSNGSQGVSFPDHPVADLFIEEFGRIFENSEEVNTLAS